ncbi:MAG: glycosyltransferase family 1 protein [Patescibacteria group bacterium]|nr:glycosyltransferase family 1 protein [Patescibacteria group bacterium]
MKNKIPKRIGIDARLFGTAQATGIGTYTEELISNLVKFDDFNQYVAFVLPEVAETFPFYAKNLKKWPVPYKHYTYSEQLLYPSVLKKARLDLIHYTNFNTPVFFTQVKSVVTVHDLTLWFFPGRKQKSWLRRVVYRQVMRQSCENATRIIAVSKGTKTDIVKYLGINADKIDVIYESAPKRYRDKVEPKRLEAIKAKHNISRPYFLYVGEWRPHKNLVRLIRAFATFKRQYQLDYQLVLVGKLDPFAPEIPETIKQLGLQDDVITTGYVADQDLPYFYAGAFAFIFPSLYEGFGIPPLEAMAAGVPVISSNASVMPEILGDAALFFNPKSLEDIAQAMYKLATTFRLQKELKDKGFQQIKKYSYTKMVKETLNTYRKALGEDI